jgi:hypothetical protein
MAHRTCIGIIAAALLISPAAADTIKDRSGKVTATIERLGDGYMVRDRRGRVTDRIECSPSSCLSTELRTGKIRPIDQETREKPQQEP